MVWQQMKVWKIPQQKPYVGGAPPFTSFGAFYARVGLFYDFNIAAALWSHL